MSTTRMENLTTKAKVAIPKKESRDQNFEDFEPNLSDA